MTKQWDVYEATIKDLYAENTLAVVRQIMIERYGFKASVRAYRGRLIRWGIRKYNCRKRASSSSSGSSSSVNDAGFSSCSDTTSPIMNPIAMAALSRGPGIEMGHRAGGGHLVMPPQMNQHQQSVYSTLSRGHQTQVYGTDNSYDTKSKVMLSPPQLHSQSSQSSSGNSMQYPWDAPPPPLPPPKRLSDASDFGSYTSSSSSGGGNSTSHHGDMMAPQAYFGAYGSQVSLNNNPYGSPQSTCYETPANGHRGSVGSAHSTGYYDSPPLHRGPDGGQVGLTYRMCPYTR
ncbi:hypothetical protein F4804DRAFT_289574 [Jackrogersella minutella]|nr:hypothetical protein F4804DRAFT_289574 [Jackrogersella minutella]